MPERLLSGFRDFRQKNYEGETPLMRELVEQGQKPNYFVVSCIDSRSNPGTIFNAPPGTFFAHKAMGAIVRPYKKGTALSAALQFALNYNEVTDIIILGHTGCGAVKALIDNIKDEEISSFITVAQAGLEKAKAKHACDNHHNNLYRHTEEEIILLSRENLKGYPAVANALKEGRVKIRAWLFDMEHGHILEYDGKADCFAQIA